MSGCHKPDCLSVCCADMRNALGELSMKINKLESSLREFEKQRINPKFEEVATDILSINGQLEGLSEHIDFLRTFEKDGVYAIDDLRNRVECLEQNNK